jgi:hypothetical protein
MISENMIMKKNGLIEFKPQPLYDEEYRDEVSKWIDESLLYISKREEYEKDNPMIITLFRYIGMNQRIDKPVSGEPIKADGRLVNKLHRAICDKTLDYFFANS